jgi:hypothetical protein
MIVTIIVRFRPNIAGVAAGRELIEVGVFVIVLTAMVIVKEVGLSRGVIIVGAVAGTPEGVEMIGVRLVFVARCADIAARGPTGLVMPVGAA